MRADAARISRARAIDFGRGTDGSLVGGVELVNRRGTVARISALGATVQSLVVADRSGAFDDVVLGFDTAAEYLAHMAYRGGTLGRCANRIANGRFKLGGECYTLELNDGAHHLHGGAYGFDKLLWQIDSISQDDEPAVIMSRASPHGEAGYPGTVLITATFTLTNDNELRIDYRATTDRPTVVNVTNHCYFNLCGVAHHRDVFDHELYIDADRYTPIGASLLPTGEQRAVAGTAFDFRAPRRVATRLRDGGDEQIVIGRGYDHNFVLNGPPQTLRLAARVVEPQSGRVLELSTTAPGLQLYSGNFLDGTYAGKGARVYRQGDGLCLEPQLFPDAPNRPEFPSAHLAPGSTFTNTIAFRFSLATNSHH